MIISNLHSRPEVRPRQLMKFFILLFVLVPICCFAGSRPVQEVTAEGIGGNEREAVEDALRNAIEESIGLYVDSETKLENDQLISDNLLTSSKGYIDKYRLLSIKTDAGLTRVKIKALVKIQDVKQKLTGLNISILSTDDSANAFARLSTKLKRSQDAEKILKKEFSDFFQTSNLLDMLTVTLQGYTIHEDELEQDNTVPYEVSFEISINQDNYNQKIKELAQVFENLGGRIDQQLTMRQNKRSPYHHVAIDSRDFNKFKAVYNAARKNKKKPEKVCFGLAAPTKPDYRLDQYCFPVEWKTIYPWKREKLQGCRHCGPKTRLDDVELVLQFTNNGAVVYEKVLKFNQLRGLHIAPLSVFKFHWPNIGYQNPLVGNWGGWWEGLTSHNIGPFLAAVTGGSGVVPNISLTYKGKINVDLLYDIQKVELKLRIKEK